MLYSQLGATGLNVSKISLGCSHLARGKGSVEILAAALDLGVNFFDTADSYGQGESERALAPILRRNRGDVYIASKIGYSTNAFGALSGKIKALWGRSGKRQTLTLVIYKRQFMRVSSAWRPIMSTYCNFTALLWRLPGPRPFGPACRIFKSKGIFERSGFHVAIYTTP